MAFEISTTDDKDGVDELLDLLKVIVDGATVRSVTDEAAKLLTPGVLVRTLGYTFNNAKKGAYTLNVRLDLAVADQDPRRARKALQKVLNAVLAVVSPGGPVVARTVLVPGDQPALLPGLSFPLNFTIAPEE